MPRPKRSASWGTLLILAVSATVFGAAAWGHLSGADGGWRHQLRGVDVGELPAMDLHGREVQIAHPALVFLFETNCSPCAPVADSLNAFARTRRPGGLPIFALTNSIGFTRDSAGLFVAGIRAVRLRQTTRELQFLKELPLLVRTDTAGRIERAFVGVPTRADLTTLGYPWEASPAGQR